MKKLLLLVMIPLIICGCKNNKKIEQEIKMATNSYYQNYVSGKVIGLDELVITLGDIRQINDQNIDLSKLDKCDDNTKIVATIENNQLVDYKININFK